MLHEEIARVRKYITAMRDPDKRMELFMSSDSANLIEMNLVSIEERVRDMELSIVPASVQNVEPPEGDKVVSLAAFKARNPQKRNVK